MKNTNKWVEEKKKKFDSMYRYSNVRPGIQVKLTETEYELVMDSIWIKIESLLKTQQDTLQMAEKAFDYSWKKHKQSDSWGVEVVYKKMFWKDFKKKLRQTIKKKMGGK